MLGPFFILRTSMESAAGGGANSSTQVSLAPDCYALVPVQMAFHRFFYLAHGLFFQCPDHFDDPASVESTDLICFDF